MKSKAHQISLAIIFEHKCESFGKLALKGLLCEWWHCFVDSLNVCFNRVGVEVFHSHLII